MIKYHIEGLVELRMALNELPEELRGKTLRKAVTQAAIIIRDDARARVPVLKTPTPHRKPGTLRNAIRVGRSKLTSSRVQESVNVFVRELTGSKVRQFKQKTGKAANRNPDDPYYWRVWEFGNGVNNSHPFLRPAFDTNAVKAATVMKVALANAIEKAAEKLRKKYARRR